MPNKPKQPCKAIRLTERDFRKLDDAVEKICLSMATRFGECDGYLEHAPDELLRMLRDWITETREYMADRAAEGETWQL